MICRFVSAFFEFWNEMVFWMKWNLVYFLKKLKKVLTEILKVNILYLSNKYDYYGKYRNAKSTKKRVWRGEVKWK